MKSIEDKVKEAYHLAMTIHSRGLGEKIQEEKISDMIYGHADGLTWNWWDKMINGQCSLKASLEFDIEKSEKKLDEEILTMEKILKGEVL